jgi:hypothetical protein
MNQLKCLSRWSVAGAAIVLIGCSSDVISRDVPPQSLDRYVTGAAALNRDSKGRFVLSVDPTGSVTHPITADRAQLLAQAWIKTIAPHVRSYLERGHGGPVMAEALAPCGQPLYAQSSYTNSEPINPAIQRILGDWWLVGLCQAGQMAVSLAVSASASDLEIHDGGLVYPESGGGNEFVPLGVPQSWEGAVPLTPEHAVAEAVAATGMRVAQVPDLIAPPTHLALPQRAVWRMKLEGPASVRGLVSGRSLSVSTVYYGSFRTTARGVPTPTLVIPAGTSIAPKEVDVGGGQMLLLTQRDDVAPIFEPFTASGVH